MRFCSTLVLMAIVLAIGSVEAACPTVRTPEHDVNLTALSHTIVDVVIGGLENKFAFGFCNQDPPSGPVFCGYTRYVNQYVKQDQEWGCERDYDTIVSDWAWDDDKQAITATYYHNDYNNDYLNISIGCGFHPELKVVNGTNATSSNGDLHYYLNMESSVVCKKKVAPKTSTVEMWKNGFCSGYSSQSVNGSSCLAFGPSSWATFTCQEATANQSAEEHYCVGANLATNGTCQSIIGLDAGVCGVCYARGGGSYEVIKGCAAGMPRLHSGCDSSCHNCERVDKLSLDSCFELSRKTSTPDYYSFAGYHPCMMQSSLTVFSDPACTQPLGPSTLVPANTCFNSMAVKCSP